MGRLKVRLDAGSERALNWLMAEGRTKTEAVRYAVCYGYRDLLIERAKADPKLADDPSYRAELARAERSERL
ncbi:hypothetical protein [Glycomyces terrestris]|uniref:CopG family transcriptional regulator n=1 Tax=Glycomyces terrestris TaxID=2493553 RepID=A0A426UXF6_9ACTN|nr:hypothetical protein [Glycomyces terrestris]RRR99302.1 hypothetical protein EIW28_11290 [Glycomyces terrestris]